MFLPSKQALEMTLKLPDITLKARQWGENSPLKILALHGWMDNAASFDPIAPELPGLNLMALDLPGHGKSDHLPPGCGLHFVDFVPTVLEVANHLKWDRFILMGHSMGAAIATLVAGCTPERIQKLILLEGMGPLSQTAEETPKRLRQSMIQERKIAERPHRHFPSVQAAISARMAGSDLDLPSASILVDRVLEKEGAGFRFTHDPRLRAGSRLRLSEEMVLAFMRGISCPTLFVVAKSGWPFPEDLMQERANSIPNLRREEIQGGHHVHMSHPVQVSNLIIDFLA